MTTPLAIVAAAVISPLASAGVAVETYGTAAPPMFVDGFSVGAAPFDFRLFQDVTTVPIVGGGLITFDSPVNVRQIGQGWATWSHGYTGNVYYSNGATSLTMTLPRSTRVFQFYGEPNPFGVFSMTATGSDGSTTTSAQQFPDGSAGATGWGFYPTERASLVSITVTCDVDFAIGEFASIPAPGTLLAMSPFALAAARRRR